jgi:hypothetical protein
MSKKVAGGVNDAAEKTVKPAQRLCNEIQLFDLCELEKCSHKKGLYCTNDELLNRFEAIAEEDERPAPSRYVSEEDDDAELSDDEAYDDACDDDDYADEEYEEDQEDE